MPPYDSVTSFSGSSFDSLKLSPKTVRDHPAAAANNNKNKTKNAYDRMEGSLAALLDFFQYSGVSPASIHELREDLFVKQKYVPLMKRLEEYARLLLISSNNDNNKEAEENTEAAHYLLLNAWEALCEYTHIQHQHAYRSFHVGRLKDSQKRQSQSFNSNYYSSRHNHHDPERAKIMRRMSLPNQFVSLTRRTSGAGAHIIKRQRSDANSKRQQQQLQQQLDLPPLQPMTLMELTLLAEQSCACQRGYILAKKSWAKKVIVQNNINKSNNKMQ